MLDDGHTPAVRDVFRTLSASVASKQIVQTEGLEDGVVATPLVYRLTTADSRSSSAMMTFWLRRGRSHIWHQAPVISRRGFARSPLPRSPRSDKVTYQSLLDAYNCLGLDPAESVNKKELQCQQVEVGYTSFPCVRQCVLLTGIRM